MARLKEVLAFINNKGGVGKTTTVQSVAAGIVHCDPKARVLCIDLDPQGNLSSLLGWNATSKKFGRDVLSYTIAQALADGDNGSLPVFRKNDKIFYVPATPHLEGIDLTLNQQMQPKQVLEGLFGNPVIDHTEDPDNGINKEGLTLVQDDFDYILIDCAPSLSVMNYNALSAASGAIIPVEMEALSVMGLTRVIDAIKNVQKHLNPELIVRGILPVRSDKRTRFNNDMLTGLKERYGEIVFNTIIRKCVKLEEAQAMILDVIEYAPDCTAAKDYIAFVKELLATTPEN